MIKKAEQSTFFLADLRERPLTTGGGGLKIWAKMTSRI